MEEAMVEVSYTAGEDFTWCDVNGDEAQDLLEVVAKNVGRSLLRTLGEAGSIDIWVKDQTPLIGFSFAYNTWAAPLEKVIDLYMAYRADRTPLDEDERREVLVVLAILGGAVRKIQELLKAEKPLTFDEITQRAKA